MDTRWRTHKLNFDPDQSALDMVDREWLLTNGTGAYAMGTVAGCNTRRYHGLLVASSRPPVGRIVALSQVLEQLVIQDGSNQEILDWTTCCFRDDDGLDVWRPQGHTKLQQFEKGLSVRWTYLNQGTSQHIAVPEIDFVRELHLHWKEQAATLQYEVRSLSCGSARPTGMVLRLSPMFTLRDFHALVRADQAGPMSIAPKEDGVVCAYRGQVVVTLRCPGANFVVAGPGQDPWWHDVHYPLESQRGQDDQEDYFVPGYFEIDLGSAQEGAAAITVSLGPQAAAPADKQSKGRQKHLKAMFEHIGAPDDGADGNLLKRTMVIAADDFVVDREFRGDLLKTVIAGYPWFADWGRDTFIALPGLLLATGRFGEAKSTLRVYAEAIQDGLVPNRFDDDDNTLAYYNSVDASLWFVHAAIEYVRVSGDNDSWRQWLADATIRVLEAFLRGTIHEIRMTGDGLVWAGSPSTQLTWMDAACDGVTFTPRHGKTVEVNALWYNALAGVGQLIGDIHKATAEHYGKLAKRIKRSFTKVFWDPQLGYLRDHVWVDQDGQEHIDRSLRPNQIIAVSLPRSPLPRTKQRQVLKAVRDELLTPYGLRTLPAGDSNYHGSYDGSAFQRDQAYHQGTIWPWLIGPYAEALMRVGEFSAAAKSQARAAIRPMLDEMAGRGLGQMHEIFSGDPPHHPAGCMAQAWSVAEVLRVLRLLEA